MASIKVNICLEDLQAVSREVNTQNGVKHYASFMVAPMRQADEYGNTHTAYIGTKRDGDLKYIGKAKEFTD